MRLLRLRLRSGESAEGQHPQLETGVTHGGRPVTGPSVPIWNWPAAGKKTAGAKRTDGPLRLQDAIPEITIAARDQSQASRGVSQERRKHLAPIAPVPDFPLSNRPTRPCLMVV